MVFEVNCRDCVKLAFLLENDLECEFADARIHRAWVERNMFKRVEPLV